MLEKRICRCGSENLEVQYAYKVYEDCDEHGEGIGAWAWAEECQCNDCGGTMNFHGEWEHEPVQPKPLS